MPPGSMPPSRDPGGQRPAGVDQLAAAAVVQREVEQQAVVRGGVPQRLVEGRPHRPWKAVEAADGVEANVVPMQLRGLVPERLAQPPHQSGDFGFRPAPVLGGEGVEGKRLGAELAAGAHDVAHRLAAVPVPFGNRQLLLLRPAAVAVHDDGDVAGQVAVLLQLRLDADVLFVVPRIGDLFFHWKWIRWRR